MQTQPADWFDTQALCQRYGIKVKYNGRWVYAGDHDGPFIFTTEEARDAKRRELARSPLPAKAVV